MAFDDSSGNAISSINVTPLVDVMLVLLVIFMVTAPILQQGVSVNLPKVAAKSLNEDELHYVVSVDSSAKVFLNDEAIGMETLIGELRELHTKFPQQTVYLRADQEVAYGEVMQVIAAIKGAGIERLGMVTDPPPVEKR